MRATEQDTGLRDEAVVPRYVPSVVPACAGAILSLAVYLFGDFFGDEFGAYQQAAVMVAITFLTCTYNFVKILREDQYYVWSPLPWFLFACAVNCGIGPTLYFFGSDMAVDYVDAFYPVDQERLLRSCLLNAVAILAVCAMCRFVMTWWRVDLYFQPKALADLQLKRLVVIFLGIGLPVRYFFVLPYEFGLMDFVLPGFIVSCSMFTSLGLFVLVYLSCSGDRSPTLQLATVIFGMSELLVSLLTFSKLTLFIVIFMIMLGIFLSRPRLSYAVGFTLVMIFVYSLTTPLVSWCRLRINENMDYRTLSGRFELVQMYVQDHGWEENQISEQDEALLIRLCIVPSQAFAMDAYDAGNPGDTFALAFYVFVPRILWPDKPSITPGIQFNSLVTGLDNSSSAPGVFAEAYWNGGWVLVVLACAYVGMLYAVATMLIVNSVKVRDFRIIPLAFFGLLMGLRIEDWFVSAYVQSLPICIIYSLVIYRMLPARANA